MKIIATLIFKLILEIQYNNTGNTLRKELAVNAVIIHTWNRTKAVVLLAEYSNSPMIS
jgi:hypothetical protein